MSTQDYHVRPTLASCLWTENALAQLINDCRGLKSLLIRSFLQRLIIIAQTRISELVLRRFVCVHGKRCESSDGFNRRTMLDVNIFTERETQRTSKETENHLTCSVV